MSKETVEPKRSLLRKSFNVVWKIFYYSMALVGIIVFMLACWVYHLHRLSVRPLPEQAVFTDLETESSFVLCPSGDKPSDYLEPINDDFWNSLPKDDAPKTIVLKRTDVDDKQLANLESRTDVEIIYLANCPNITDQCVDYLARVPNLRRIVLDGCEQLESPDFEKLCALKALNRLSLRNCVNLTDASLPKIAKLSSLKALQLSGCSKLTAKGMESLYSLPLVKFSPPECLLDDEHIRSLLNYPYLRDLSINCSPNDADGLPLSDDGLLQVERLKYLKYIEIRNCPQLSERSVLLLFKKFCQRAPSILAPQFSPFGKRTSAYPLDPFLDVKSAQ